MEKYDLIVIGGGFAGTAAAISASRRGLSVLLAEKGNCLGGAACVNLVTPFMQYRTKVGDDFRYLSKGVFGEIVENLMKVDSRTSITRFHDEYLKLVLNRMAVAAGVELLFDVQAVSVSRTCNRIDSVTVFGKGNSFMFEADYYIDATGNADVAAMAGFPFRLGREADSLCQPMTLCFRVVNVDMALYNEEKDKINPLYKQYKSEGKILNPREDVLVFTTLTDGVLHFNTTRIVKRNPTDIFDVTKAEIEAREQVFEIFDFLTANFACFKNSEIGVTASEIGIRESRMIDGEYLLTGKELKDCARFSDSIATGNYDIDIHNPEGSGTSHYYFPVGKYYEIPYRCLIPKNSENFLVAGRSVSVDHEAQASIRIMPIVCCLGEAAGTAVAVAKRNKSSVKNVDIKDLQSDLLKNGAVFH